MRRVRFLLYLRAQMQRAKRLLPQLFALTLALTLAAALGGFVLSARSEGDAAKQKIRIGVVGSEGDAFLRAGLYAVETLDLTRFSLSLLPMEERQAASMLDHGALEGYVVIPEGFVEGMQLGEHKPLHYYTAGSGAGLGSRLTREIAALVSELLLESENAVYGAQRYIADFIPGRDPWADGDALARRYLLNVLDRTALYELETVGAGGGLSFPGYYLCGLSVAFLLLSGLNAAPLAMRRSEELGQLLRLRGLCGWMQTGAEYLAFAFLSVVSALCAALFGAVLAQLFGLGVPEMAARTLGENAALWLRALPAVLMLAAMQFAFYELAPGTVGALLLQVLNALAQAYAAGCFYPASFFPEGFRRLGALLPAGAGLRLFSALLSGSPAGGAAGAVWLWCAAFLILTAALRERRLRSGGEARI